MMKILNSVFMAASMLIVTVALAGEGATKHVQIAIDHSSDGENIVLNLDSDSMGFNLHDMQEGETQSIIDDSGRAILITRQSDGFKFDVDGKTIEIPLFEGEHSAMMLSGVGMADFDLDMDSNIHVIRKAGVVHSDNFDGVTIISANPIDDATRESIKSVLTSSGQTGEVTFIDQNAAHNTAHKIITIKKEVTANH